MSARAESIGRALRLVGAGNPGTTARVVSPMEPGWCFGGEAMGEEGAVGLDPTVGNAA